MSCATERRGLRLADEGGAVVGPVSRGHGVRAGARFARGRGAAQTSTGGAVRRRAACGAPTGNGERACRSCRAGCAGGVARGELRGQAGCSCFERCRAVRARRRRGLRARVGGRRPADPAFARPLSQAAGVGICSACSGVFSRAGLQRGGDAGDWRGSCYPRCSGCSRPACAGLRRERHASTASLKEEAAGQLRSRPDVDRRKRCPPLEPAMSLSVAAS